MSAEVTTDLDQAGADPVEPRRGLARSASRSRWLGWLLLVAGLIGTVAAFVLTVEKVALLTDPAYVPSCSINPVLSCGSVMSTDQAEVFGFPNSLLGVAGFPVVVASGAALLAGARLHAWYWRGLQAGVTFAMGLVVWLQFQSLYRIGALCPYCMVVWAVVIPLFWYVTAANLAAGHLGDRATSSRLTGLWVGNSLVVVTMSYLLVLVLVAQRFWDYWVTLLS